MITSVKYPVGQFSIFENFIIAVIHEGQTVLPEHNAILVEIANTYFKDRPFAYITNRIHSYSVNPKVYYETSKIENLAAFAIVSENKVRAANASLENLFFKKPFQSFSKLIEAIDWSESVIKDQNKL